jgi:hypothetical protein
VLRQVLKIPRSGRHPAGVTGQDHVGDGHRRPAPAPGRSLSGRGQRQPGRPAGIDPPASLGEKLVIRILNAKATVLSLDSLGLQKDEQTTMAKLLQNKEGILLVTGPTGVGKDHDAVRGHCVRSRAEGVNIVTVEDPVEYRLGSNIVQVQVNEKAGLTFATALRSILRQDPDVVLIGEIRIRRRRRSRSRPPSPDTWCSRRCTPTTHRTPSPDS